MYEPLLAVGDALLAKHGCKCARGQSRYDHEEDVVVCNQCQMSCKWDLPFPVWIDNWVRGWHMKLSAVKASVEAWIGAHDCERCLGAGTRNIHGAMDEVMDGFRRDVSNRGVFDIVLASVLAGYGAADQDKVTVNTLIRCRDSIYLLGQWPFFRDGILTIQDYIHALEFIHRAMMLHCNAGGQACTSH